MEAEKSKPARASPERQEQDEDMVKVPLADLSLDPREYRSEYVDDSFHEKQGMVIQFLNGSCPGATTVIGGIRTNLMDIRKAPLYLSHNKALIKHHASRFLLDHWRDLNYGMGSTETITVDDFGVTFTLASLSPTGCKWNPLQRMEGPLFFCHLPALVMPQTVIHSDWNTQVEEVAVHVINAYITLLPPHQRRTALMRKDKEEKAAAAAMPSPVYLTPTGYSGPTTKKSRPNPSTHSASHVPTASGSHKAGSPSTKPQNDTAALRQEMLHLHAIINRLQSQMIPSPALPASRNPTWPRTSGGSNLPDDL